MYYRKTWENVSLVEKKRHPTENPEGGMNTSSTWDVCKAVKHKVYNSSIGSWRGVPSHHVETIKRELQKYHKLLKTFKKIMSNNYIGKNYKQPNRFYRLNWALDPQFDYSYPSSIQEKEESNVDVPYTSSISTMKEQEEEEVNVHADPLNNYDEL